jgi:hypothetical protein
MPVIDRDRRDDRGTRPRDDIGCIEPSAETDLQRDNQDDDALPRLKCC